MGKKCQHFTEYQQKDLLNLFQKSEDFFPGTLGRCKTPTVYFLIFYTYNCIILYWSYGLYPREWSGVPRPPLVCLNGSLLLSLNYFLCVWLLAVGIVYIPMTAKAICNGMAKGFVAERGRRLVLGSLGAIT